MSSLAGWSAFTLLIALPTFVAGWKTAARPAATTRAPRMAAAALEPARGPAPVAMVAAVATTATPRRPFTPPSLPADDAAAAEFLRGTPQARAAMLAQAIATGEARIDRRMDELFGADYSPARRAQIRAAQRAWVTERQRAAYAYYTGEIDQTELTRRTHQQMLAWAASAERALPPGDYRQLTGLAPGADPFVAMMPLGAKVGDRAGSDGPPAPEGQR